MFGSTKGRVSTFVCERLAHWGESIAFEPHQTAANAALTLVCLAALSRRGLCSEFAPWVSSIV